MILFGSFEQRVEGWSQTVTVDQDECPSKQNPGYRLMQMQYYDKNGKELKIGQTVLIRTGDIGEIIREEYDNTTHYFLVKISNETSPCHYFSSNLTCLSIEEAMLYKLESYA